MTDPRLFLWLFCIAAVLAFAATAALKAVAPGGFLVANMRGQDGDATPVRQLGGLAIVPVMAVLLATAGPYMRFAWNERWFLVAAIAIVWITGAVDDRRHLKVLPRLAAQLAAAMLTVAALGPEFSILPESTWPGGGLADRLVAVGFVMWMINITNFMDGMDLMTVGGIGVPALLTGVALMLFGVSGPPLAVAAILAGVLAGFSPFNAPPASLYLGDSGSLAAGVAAAYLSLEVANEAGIVAGLLPFAYYHADAGLTLLHRLYDGENIFRAHTRHLYQRLGRAGIPVWTIFLVVCGLALMLFALLCAILSAGR